MKKDSSDLLLLDVNVLLALAWPNHQFHRTATRRLERSSQRWATCALTQLGFLRLSSNPAAVSPPKSPAAAALLLSEMTQDPSHVYLDSLPPPVSPGRLPGWKWVLGHRQVTDAYLLDLAEQSGAVLLTFDTRLKALASAERCVETIGV